MPTSVLAVGPWIASFFQPWLSLGLGAPQPYPTFYWIGLVFWPFHAVISSWWLTLVTICATILLACYAAFCIGNNFGAATAARYAAATLAALNPWVYSKYVAGHIFMVLAYALALALVAEVTRPKPRRPALVLLAATSITQLQFFVLLVVPFVVWCARRREWPPLLALGLTVLPVATGIALYYGQLRQTLYALAWQQANSVPLSDGILMLGYQFHYADAFAPWKPAIAILGALAIYGAVVSWRSATVRLVACFAVCAALFASGTSGAFSDSYVWLVKHLPETGVFREMYDLIAVVAVAYVALLSAAFRGGRFPALALFSLAAAASLSIPWLTRPPTIFFVVGSSVRAVSFPSNPTERVALFPAYQPQTFAGKGSGYDPDLYEQAGRSTPINEFNPTFPSDEALSYALYNGNFGPLGALGVSTIISRPYLSTDWKSLSFQQASIAKPVGMPKTGKIAATPVIAVTLGRPRVTADPQDLSSNAIFFTDSPVFSNSYKVFFGAQAAFDKRKTWIDARYDMISHPERSTVFGGVVTDSRRPLRIPAGFSNLLVQINGKLLDARATAVATSNPRLRWVHLPAKSPYLTCAGECAVILAAAKLPAETPPTSVWDAVQYRALAPWLIIGQLPASSITRTVRFAETYSPYWFAVAGSKTLPHLRVNSALNGWIVPGGIGGRLVLVQVAALVQFLFEIVAFVVCLVLFVAQIRKSGSSLALVGTTDP